jgi:hypothetical protein
VAALLTGALGTRTTVAALPAPQAFRENCSFLMDLRNNLARRVEGGECSMAETVSARCPLCKETVVIGAKDAVAYFATIGPLQT